MATSSSRAADPRQLLRDDLAPFAEAHENVPLHRQITFEEIRHGRRLDAQHCLGDRGDQLLGGGHRGRVLAEEHRAVDGEVEVMDHVDQIDARIVGVSKELTVGASAL